VFVCDLVGALVLDVTAWSTGVNVVCHMA